jgi:hypothetical protein
LLSLSRVYRSLGLPDLVAANLALRQRQRDFAEDQMIESLCLLQALGGECPEDIGLLAHDACLERGLGYAPPKATAAREFLERFHDPELEKLGPERPALPFRSAKPTQIVEHRLPRRHERGSFAKSPQTASRASGPCRNFRPHSTP